jgi:hypothetical protein
MQGISHFPHSDKEWLRAFFRIGKVKLKLRRQMPAVSQEK